MICLIAQDLALCEESVTRATSGWHSMENEDVFVNVDHILTSLEKVGYVLAGSIVDSVHPGNSLTGSCYTMCFIYNLFYCLDFLSETR